MNRIWAAKIAVTIVAALVSVWVYFASDAQFDALLAPLPAMRSARRLGGCVHHAWHDWPEPRCRDTSLTRGPERLSEPDIPPWDERLAPYVALLQNGSASTIRHPS